MSESNTKPEMISRDELVERYGDTPMRFRSYYKYSFVFEGTTAGGGRINASIGGSADDIYREQVDTEVRPLSSLDARYATIRETQDGEIIAEYNGY